MGLSLPHLIVLALVVLLLFGRGKISDLMGDFGKGIKSFKDGIAEETASHSAGHLGAHLVTPPAQLTTHVPAQSYAQPASVQPASAPHPEVVPHGQAAVQPAAAVQPMLNGEPLAEQPAKR